VEAFGVLIKFKMALPWKPRYQTVWRETCYDHFSVFLFFIILAVSMAMAAILKIPKLVCTSTHSA
jgi:hypothetical protein